jgi:plastocyanin
MKRNEIGTSFFPDEHGGQIVKRIILGALFLSSVGTATLSYAGVISGKVEITEKSDLENIVVYLENVGGKYPLPSKRPTMNHINLQFVPKVLPVLKGTTIDFPNSDPVLHSAFSISKSNPFELGVYGQGHEKFYAFQNPGVVELFCHIHSHMHAYVIVLDNPFFATTAKDGTFSITGVPDGTYQIKAWADPDVSGVKTVTVNGNNSVSLNFILASKN